MHRARKNTESGVRGRQASVPLAWKRSERLSPSLLRGRSTGSTERFPVNGWTLGRNRVFSWASACV